MSTESSNPHILTPILPGVTPEVIKDYGSVELGTQSSLQLEAGAHKIDDSNLIKLARQLTARSYLKSGFVSQDQVGEDGVILPEEDPFVDSSDYYVVVNDDSQIIATTRKIHFTTEKADDSFPVWRYRTKLDQEKVEEIENIGLENCVEISALSKEPGLDKNKDAALLLYKKIVQDALKKNNSVGVDKEEVFLMASSPKLHSQLTALFNGGIRQIGPKLDYPGEEVIPAIFKPEEGMISVIQSANDGDNPEAALHRFVANFILDGLTKEEVGPNIAKALEQNGFNETLISGASRDVGFNKDIGRKLKIGAFSLATMGIIAFEQLPTNEAVRTMVAFDTLDHVDSAVIAGLAVGAATMVIEGSASTAVAYGLNHESMTKVQAYIRARREKKVAIEDSEERTKADSLADLALAVSIGPAIAVAKRHYEDGPDLKRDIYRGLGYSAIGASLSAGIAYVVTGGAKHAEKVGLGDQADYLVGILSDWKFWTGAMLVGYTTSKIQKIVRRSRKSESLSGDDNVVR